MTLKNSLLAVTSVLALSIGSGAIAQSTDLTQESEGEIASEPMIPNADLGSDMSTDMNHSNMDTDTSGEMTSPVEGSALTESTDSRTDYMSDFAGMTVGDVVGKNVIGAKGETVGEIDYILSDGGKYEAVVGVGGLLGLGEYTVALPLEKFSMMDDGALRLPVMTEEDLKALPQIDESEINSLESDYVLS